MRAGRERLAELTRETGGDPPAVVHQLRPRGYPDPRWVFRGLNAQGILTRRIDGLDGHVRITVPRNDAEFRRLDAAMRALVRPDALLFDMDGVLADVRRSYRAAIASACASFGVRVSPDEIEAAKARDGANDDWAVTHRLLADAGVARPWPKRRPGSRRRTRAPTPSRASAVTSG